MEFRLTYAGELLSMGDRGGQKLKERSLHVHRIRKVFHRQLKALWDEHPMLRDIKEAEARAPRPVMMHRPFTREGFTFVPIATAHNGLICKVDILMLRSGPPGEVVHDVVNRLKTLFDALRMPTGPQELGAGTASGLVAPEPDENPFYVLLED